MQEKSKDFGQYRSIYIGKVQGFWSISFNLYRKIQRILINIDRFIQEKSKGFLLISVNLYGKSQRILVNIGRFIQETSKDFGQYWQIEIGNVKYFSMHRSIYTEKVNGFLPTSVDSNSKSEKIVVNIGGFIIILFL